MPAVAILDAVETVQTLEDAARASLRTYAGSQEQLTPLYLQPDRAVFLANNANLIFKVYVNGHALQHEYATAQQARAVGIPIPDILGIDQHAATVLTLRRVHGVPLSSHTVQAAQSAGRRLVRFHQIGARPPFSGGQQRWDDFIAWWSSKEIASLAQLNLFSQSDITQLQQRFVALRPALSQRPTVLLHGDLQAAHILVDEQTDAVTAFLDFADAQPGDPLLDIAVLTLWDQALAAPVLLGYFGAAPTAETHHLIEHYRLLRHIAEAPWLTQRGFTDLAERNVAAIRRALAG